jgi:hypothetical protein
VQKRIVTIASAVALAGATGGAIAVAANSSGSGSGAGAAAGQYCPQLRDCAVPPVPAGFSTVAQTGTFTSKGGKLSTKTGGGTVTVKVPNHATNRGIQVAIDNGSNSTVQKDLPKAFKRFKVVASFGITVTSGSKSTSTSKPITVSFAAAKIAKGEIVLVYSPKTGKFTKLKGAVIRNGKVVVHLKSGESLAIVAPPKHK